MIPIIMCVITSNRKLKQYSFALKQIRAWISGRRGRIMGGSKKLFILIINELYCLKIKRDLK